MQPEEFGGRSLGRNLDLHNLLLPQLELSRREAFDGVKFPLPEEFFWLEPTIDDTSRAECEYSHRCVLFLFLFARLSVDPHTVLVFVKIL